MFVVVAPSGIMIVSFDFFLLIVTLLPVEFVLSDFLCSMFVSLSTNIPALIVPLLDTSLISPSSGLPSFTLLSSADDALDSTGDTGILEAEDFLGDLSTALVLSNLGTVGVFLIEVVDLTDRTDTVDFVLALLGLSLVGSIGGTGGAWR